jgi:ATP-dependent RNA helicase RhlE
VHRIGRTGRALAIGDAISFVTPEDHGALRSLERFIGRGLVRKRAEGFDYAAPAPPPPPERDGERRFAHASPGGNGHRRSGAAPRNGGARGSRGSRRR